MTLDERVGVAAAGIEVGRYDAILLAVPSQQLRDAARTIAPELRADTPVVACAKGIERGSHRFMTEVIAESAPRALPAILSGPSFAEDVARGLPAAVTLAARDESVAAALAGALGSAVFRPYHSTDVRGVEIGGAAKNVLAIAAGIVAGRGLGASAAAAVTTRGFAELFRFGKAFGARPETLTGSLRAGRPHPHLLERGSRATTRSASRSAKVSGRTKRKRASSSPKACHRARADRDGEREGHRDADRARGRRHPRRPRQRRRGDREFADAADPGRVTGCLCPLHARCYVCATVSSGGTDGLLAAEDRARRILLG